MPLVIVALAGQGAAIGQLQITLRSLQSLDRGLLVHAQHNGLRGRDDIEADNIRGFGRKVRVVALTPGLASHEVNLVAAQEPPDILIVFSAQRPGQQGPGPACEPFRRQLVQQLQNPLVSGLRIDRLLARSRLVLQPFKAFVGIAMPPKADNPRLDLNFLGDRPGAAPIRRQQNYPRPLQIALQRHRRATARLKHLAIFPRKVDFSCFGYHPYLESRLTIQEKWVLVWDEGESRWITARDLELFQRIREIAADPDAPEPGSWASWYVRMFVEPLQALRESGTNLSDKPKLRWVKPIKSREDALKAVDNTSTVFFVVAGIQAIIGLAVAASFSKSAFDIAINAGLIGVGLYVAFASWLRWGRSRFAALLLLLMALYLS